MSYRIFKEKNRNITTINYLSSQKAKTFSKVRKQTENIEKNPKILFPFSHHKQNPQDLIEISVDEENQTNHVNCSYRIILNSLENLLSELNKNPYLMNVIYRKNGRNSQKLEVIYEQVRKIIKMGREKLSIRQCVHMRYLNKLNYLKMKHRLPFSLWKQIKNQNLRIKTELLKTEKLKFIERIKIVQANTIDNFYNLEVQKMKMQKKQGQINERISSSRIKEESLIIEQQIQSHDRDDQFSSQNINMDKKQREENDEEQLYENYSLVFNNSNVQDENPFVLSIHKAFEIAYNGKSHRWRQDGSSLSIQIYDEPMHHEESISSESLQITERRRNYMRQHITINERFRYRRIRRVINRRHDRIQNLLQDVMSKVDKLCHAAKKAPIVLDPERVVVDPERIVIDPERIVIDPEHIVLDPEHIVLDPQRIVIDPERIVIDAVRTRPVIIQDNSQQNSNNPHISGHAPIALLSQSSIYLNEEASHRSIASERERNASIVQQSSSISLEIE